MRKVMVVTSAYGRQQVREKGGQQALLPVISAAGADGVEIRRELFDADELTRLSELGAAIAAQRLDAFYSVPEALLMTDGTLNPNMAQRLDEARQLGAQLIKFAVGHFLPGVSERALQAVPCDPQLALVVENDQTSDGSLAAIESVPLPAGISGLTFDIGNWLWLGEDPQKAARQLADRVRYIHIKAVQRHQQALHTVALDDSDGSWRTVLSQLPADIPRGIEFPLEGDDLVAVTRRYVDLLREE